MPKKALLMILDGFGIGDKRSSSNAIEKAPMPYYQSLLKDYLSSELLTHGPAVGLPEGVMGNSEVGHMTIGSGRILYQDLVRINRSIEDGSLAKNPILTELIQKTQSGRVHLMGLLSDGGVHSHINHLIALIEILHQKKISEIIVHPFLDGRDTPPDSGKGFVQKLLSHPCMKKSVKLGSLMGRYYAMDRDKRWERTQLAYDTLCGKKGAQSMDPVSAIEASYQKGKTDEFMEPILLNENAAFKNGDVLLFFNYRADRARQLSEKILSKEYFTPAFFAGMCLYDKRLAVPALFGPDHPKNNFTQLLARHHLNQLRIAETEKYAHVTFFFNGGVEEKTEGEERILIPSPRDVPTYDLKPEMSAKELAQTLKEQLSNEKFDFVLINFANGDMVGHTGIMDATLQAMRVLDGCLQTVIETAKKKGYHVFLTADHGNAEQMVDENGKPHTQHTLNPVPFVWVWPEGEKPSFDRLKNGTLADIMPTLCQIMGLPIPREVTGHSLLLDQTKSH